MDANDFEIVPAPAAARPFVRRCMYANRAIAGMTMRPKPTGYIYFSNWFDLAEPEEGWRVVIDGTSYRRDSRWYLAGQIVDQDIAVHLRGRASVVFCELSATALHRLFGVPGADITGAGRPISYAGSDYERLARQCYTAGIEAARERHLEEVEHFFSALADRAAPGDPAVERAVEIFEATNGAVKVSDICREIGLGQRQLARRFSHIVGVTPKFFGQVLQINWVVGALYFNDIATLTQIAHDAGFYDQAHFNHAMRRFFSEGPREFLRSDHVAFKTFLGASRRFGPGSPPG